MSFGFVLSIKGDCAHPKEMTVTFHSGWTKFCSCSSFDSPEY
eukprot:COSAG02_NODE_2917_length_7753_cov_60.228508_2_plen_42_part_00